MLGSSLKGEAQRAKYSEVNFEEEQEEGDKAGRPCARCWEYNDEQ